MRFQFDTQLLNSAILPSSLGEIPEWIKSFEFEIENYRHQNLLQIVSIFINHDADLELLDKVVASEKTARDPGIKFIIGSVKWRLERDLGVVIDEQYSEYKRVLANANPEDYD